jgi:hypothetical protein
MSYNITMIKYLALMLGGLMIFGSAFPVAASGPQLVLNSRGRGVESAGAWGNSADARVGDTFWLWIAVQNSVAGTTANNVRVKVDLPTGESGILVLTVHARADNAPEITQNLTINLLKDFKSDITYLPGNAMVITSLTGIHRQVQPDSTTANLTTQEVSIGDVVGGDFTYAQLLATTTIGMRTATIAPTVTPTVTPTVLGTGGATATASAVASTTPSTGVNEIIWPTLLWLGVGISGYSIRTWARQKSG